MVKSKSIRKSYGKSTRNTIISAARTAARALPYAKKAYNAYKKTYGRRKSTTSSSTKTSRSSTRTRVNVDMGLSRNQADTPGALLVRNQTIVMNKGKWKRCMLKYQHSYNQVALGKNGEQLVTLANCILPRLGTSNIDSTRINQTSYGADLFSFQPRYKGVLPQFAPSYPVDFDATTYDAKIFVGRVDSTLCLSNLSLASVIVDVYWCCPVKNYQNAPTLAWDLAIQDGSINGVPAAQWNSNNAIGGANAGSIQAKEQPGVVPQMSEYFKKFWSIKKKDTFNLEAGQIKELKTKVVYNKVFTLAAQRAAQDNGSKYVTGQSVFPMIVVRSAPVLMQFGTGPGYNEEMTYAEAKIGIMHTQIVHIGGVDKPKEMNTIIEFNGNLHNAAPVNVVEAETANIFTGTKIHIGV